MWAMAWRLNGMQAASLRVFACLSGRAGGELRIGLGIYTGRNSLYLGQHADREA